MSNPHWTFGYYVTAWPRFPPYLVGILFGWILHQTKNTKIIISKVFCNVRHLGLFFAWNKMFNIYYLCLLRYLVHSSYWLDLGYSHCSIDHIRIDTLLGWNSSTRNERNNKSVLRHLSSTCLVDFSWLGHICVCSWLWRTGESVSIVESVYPTKPTHLRCLFDSSRLSVLVVIPLEETYLLYFIGLFSVVFWSPFRIASTGFSHRGHGRSAIPQFGKTDF